MSFVGVSSSRKVTKDRERFPSLDYQNRKLRLLHIIKLYLKRTLHLARVVIASSSSSKFLNKALLASFLLTSTERRRRNKKRREELPLYRLLMLKGNLFPERLSKLIFEK